MHNFSNTYCNIAVEGCLHGQLDEVYKTIAESGAQVDLLLICGDFQSLREYNDLNSCSIPKKYQSMGTFSKYVTGESIAPVLTIFIGGNHEASNVLHSLYYGGYVAPNIYYLGFGGVIQVKGLRIAGISGIYNKYNYNFGHDESFPYDESSCRSIYHTRSLEIHRLSRLTGDIDIFLSHDWPQGIWDHGDKKQLLKHKPFLRDEIEKNEFGNPPLMQLLNTLKPHYWFAAHMHTKFPALVVHNDNNDNDTYCASSSNNNIKYTRFLALDKVIPGRDFLQFLRIPKNNNTNINQTNNICLDEEWMCILKDTHDLLRCTPRLPRRIWAVLPAPAPGSVNSLVSNYFEYIRNRIAKVYPNGIIPNIFPRTVPKNVSYVGSSLFPIFGDEQTDKLLSCIEEEHIWTKPVQYHTYNVDTNMNIEIVSNIMTVATSSEAAKDENEIDIDDL